MISVHVSPVRPEDLPGALAALIAERGGLDEAALDALGVWLGASRVELAESDGEARVPPAGGVIQQPLPLRFGGESLGSLVIERPSSSPAIPPVTLDAIAATCAVALAVRRRSVDLNGRNPRVRAAIDRVRRSLSERPDSTQLMQLLAGAAVDILRADAAAVGLIDAESSEIRLRAAAGHRQGQLIGLLRSAGEGFSTPALDELRPRVVALDQVGAAADLRGDLASVAIGHLQIRQRAVGAIAVASTAPGAFSADDLAALNELLEEASAAIENARLFESLQDRLIELSALHEVSKAFNSLGDLDAALETLVTRIAALLDAERCVVLLLDDAKTVLTAVKPAFGLTDDDIEALRVPLRPDSAAQQAWCSGEPYISNDASSSTAPHLAGYAQRLGDRTMLIAPLQVSARPIGVLRVSNKRNGKFTRADARLLMVLATQAAAVVENERLFAAVEHEREMLSAVFEHTSDGIVVVDEDRRVVTFNTAMERLTGYSASAVVGRRCHERYQCHDETGHAICMTACPLQRVMNGDEQIPYFETRFSTREGGLRDVAVSYSVVSSPSDPANRYGISIARDISHLKEVERAKSEFISTVSHELRTPLASIQASIGTLKEHAPADFPEPLLRLIGNIDRSSQRLNTIVSDLLDLASLQNGRITLDQQRIDTREPVEAAVAMIRPLAEGRQQSIAVERPASAVLALGDRARIEQVTLNLLSNAVKYSPNGATIVVRVSRAGTFAKISVTDQGTGIPPGEQKRIFERFYRRSDSATQRAIGSGLGLPIARALVDLHGGSIWVDSQPGQGSTFSFTIPSVRPVPIMSQAEHKA